MVKEYRDKYIITNSGCLMLITSGDYKGFLASILFWDDVYIRNTRIRVNFMKDPHCYFEIPGFCDLSKYHNYSSGMTHPEGYKIE